MATFSRVGVNGWRQGDDSSAQARVGVGGWYQVVAVGGGGASVNPGAGELVLTGVAPTVAATAHVSVTAGVGELVLAGFAPSVDVTTGSTPVLSDATVTSIMATQATPRVTVTFS